jgi:sterol desaturase/sphingolipid hydroxylase (fatty acid hydroxylase superfamily)
VGLLLWCIRLFFSHRFFFQSFELSAYVWVHERYQLPFCLPWNSPLTYWITFLGIDFSYYWFHRFAHGSKNCCVVYNVFFSSSLEVNIFWATHQTHHSAENYNLSTALRQGFFQTLFAWTFYLPLAFIVPPPMFLVHMQMNLLFQFWVHTEVISNLGPLEFIFNTPSHHRVHHGRNPYCIDKNFGGVLIVWDRLFGTFAVERKSEEIAYGLVYSPVSFDPLKIQVTNVPNSGIINKSLILSSWATFSTCTINGSSLKDGKISYPLFGRAHLGSPVYLGSEITNIRPSHIQSESMIQKYP